MSPFFTIRSGRVLVAALVSLATFAALPARGQSLSAGRETTAVVGAQDNALWVWGNNAQGQLGMETNGNQLTPARLGTEEWKAVAAGAEHMVAIATDGSLWSWGQNASGQLGRNNFVSDPLPGRIGAAKDWKAVAAGDAHTLALRSNGDLYVWGNNANGQLGNGSSVARSTPLKLSGGPFKAIAGGQHHSLAITSSGELWAWGLNLSGQLGIGPSGAPWEQRTPVRVGTASNWVRVAAGQEHSLAIQEDGSLWAWGHNYEGQLGLGSTGFYNATPQRVGGGAVWKDVAAGALHTLALRKDGTLWTWGQNFHGQLGLGTMINENQPRKVGTDTDWIAIAGGALHSAALKSSGVLWTSGSNSHGQLGNDSNEQRGVLEPSFFGVPDLVMSLALPEEVALGEPLQANISVQNRGSGPVLAGAGFQVEVRRSLLPEWDEDADVVLSFPINDGFAPGESRSYSRPLSMGNAISAGTYYFSARVNGNGAVEEMDEENNYAQAEHPIDFLADLTLGELVVAPVSMERGSAWALNVTIVNSGVAFLPTGTPIEVSVRMGARAEWNATDNVVLVNGEIDELGLAAGEEREISFSDLTIPLHTPAGDYFIGAWIDPKNQIHESNEENNLRWSAAANLNVTGLEIGEGIGQPGYSWTTGGHAGWFAQDAVQHDGETAVQSPPLAEGEAAWFQTHVPGPVVVKFHWKTESQSPNNYLKFSLDGAEQARVFGTRDWEERVILAPSASNQLRWTYVKEDLTDGSDAAWVSGLTFEPVTEPDLLITEIDYEEGDYVLQRDKVTIRAYGKNQGIATSIPSNFKMEVRISKTRDWEGETTSLGFLNKLQDLDADNRFIYQSTLSLPETLEAGNYYIGVFADSTDVISEFDEDNNIGWSEIAGLRIERRPDIRAVNLTYEPGIYSIGMIEDQLTLSFDLVNAGLADVPAELFNVRVILSPNREPDQGSESVLLDIDITEGLHAGQSRPYNVTTFIPEGTATGMFQYVGVRVDIHDDVLESREDNNVTLTDSRDVFVQTMPLATAMDREDLDWQTGNHLNNPPWYGQSEIFFSENEPRGAARAPKAMRIGEQADMVTTVVVQGPSPVSFFWKVDSAQHFVDEVLVRHNRLAFFIDDVEMASISGNVDWRQETFHLPEADRPYTLRWSYIKEIAAAGDADTGWVDRLTYTAPDLVLADVDYDAKIYEPGDPLKYTITIANEGGLDVPLTPTIAVQVRLAPNRREATSLDWTVVNAIDIVLETFELTAEQQEALVLGGEISLERSVVVPGGLNRSGDFYLGAWVDYNRRITEGDRGNNLWWPESADITLLAPLGLAEALGLDVEHPGGWKIGGQGAWSGQQGTYDPSIPGNGSAAQSPILQNNQQAWFEAEIAGPALMGFSWKVSSRKNFNFLRLYVSGERVKQISGEVDWEQVAGVFIPAGPQTIRWSYEKTSGPGEDLDTAWVDDIVLTPVTVPDLLVTAVDYEPGAYVLERDRLTVTVTAENRGAPFPAGIEWDVSDVEMRLSSNRVVGDDDDVVLGHFARVEVLESGARLVFSGDLHLPLNPPLPARELFEGDYYLIAKVAPFADIDEYTDENNTWIAAQNHIEIRRLPHMVSDDFTFDPSKAYFPYAPLEVDWMLRNRGLGDVTGSIPYVQEIQLLAMDRANPKPDDAHIVANLSVFTESAYLPGVSEYHPDGSGLLIHSRMTLPSPANLLAGLGEVPEGLEEGDARVLANLDKIEEHVYFIRIVTDATIAIEQSSDLRISDYLGSTFDIFSLKAPGTYAEWLDQYPGLVDSDPEASPEGDGIPNLFKYALNLNPWVSDSEGENMYLAYGRQAIHEKDYFRITFNMVNAASDLRYIVEVSEDLAVWSPLMELEPPYLDEHGPKSLTGINGLITNPLVVSASDQGYTAAVTVRDHTPIDELPSRFLRLRVELKP